MAHCKEFHTMLSLVNSLDGPPLSITAKQFKSGIIQVVTYPRNGSDILQSGGNVCSLTLHSL